MQELGGLCPREFIVHLQRNQTSDHSKNVDTAKPVNCDLQKEH